MKRKYSFLWIDDDPTRKKDLDTLKRRLNVDGEFKNVSGQNIATEVDGILSEPKFKFDLILIDHYMGPSCSDGKARIFIQ